MLALLYASQGNLVGATEQLRLWQALAPTDPGPHRALAQVLAQTGRLQEALREQTTAVTLVPASASDWNDLGVLEIRAGNRDAARNDFSRALALDPALEAAQNNIKKL